MSLLAQDLMEPVLDGMAETDRILREEILTDDTESVLSLFQHVSQFSGKRLRPAMVHLCGGLVNGRNHELAVIGAMLEALHMATLLHDDVLDHAKMRRKVPTLNALHGNQVPVLLGDMIYARTFDLSLKLPTLVAAREMSLMTQDLCRGEIDQSFFRFDGHPDEERYYRVIKGKTAAMFKSSCFLGIHYGGGTDEQAATMARFGIEIGTAFQIIDDCLDVVGDERVAGKSLGTDLETGKVTLPVIRLARELDAAGVAKLKTLLNDPNPGDRRARLRDEFPIDAAVRECHEEADNHLRGCIATLDDFPEGPARQSMVGLCTFVLERSY